MQAQGIALEYNESIAPAFGMSYGGRIALLPGQTKAEEFSVLVHEVAHERIHKGEQDGPLHIIPKRQPEPIEGEVTGSGHPKRLKSGRHL